MRQTNAIKSLRKENGYLSEEIGLLKAQIMDDKKSGAGSKKSILMREQAGMCWQRLTLVFAVTLPMSSN